MAKILVAPVPGAGGGEYKWVKLSSRYVSGSYSYANQPSNKILAEEQFMSGSLSKGPDDVSFVLVRVKGRLVPGGGSSVMVGERNIALFGTGNARPEEGSCELLFYKDWSTYATDLYPLRPGDTAKVRKVDQISVGSLSASNATLEFALTIEVYVLEME